MATNNFLPFATSDGAQVMPQDTYALKAGIGVTPGIADCEFANKTWRQGSLAAAVLGAIIATDEGSYKGVDASDAQSTSTLRTNVLKALSTIVPTNMPDKIITNAKLADASVDTRVLADRSVTGVKLAQAIDLKASGITLQLKAYSTAERIKLTFAQGELVLDLNSYSLYVGDGSTAGGTLLGGQVAQEVESIKQILAQLTEAVAKLGGETVPFGD